MVEKWTDIVCFSTMPPETSDQRPEELLGGLPRTRPQRRSARRPARAPQAKPGVPQPAKPAPRARKSAGARTPPRPARRSRLSQPPQPAGTPPAPARRGRVPASGTEILTTAVQAAAELAQIGAAAGARALRSAFGRVPRP